MGIIERQKFVSIDRLINLFKPDLMKKLFNKYKGQFVLDGLIRFVKFNDNYNRRIQFDKFKDYFETKMKGDKLLTLSQTGMKMSTRAESGGMSEELQKVIRDNWKRNYEEEKEPKKKEKPIKNKKGQTFRIPTSTMGNSAILEECIFFERNLENLHNLIYKNEKYKTFSKNKEYDINSSFIKLFEFKHFFIPSFKKIDFEENLKCRNYYDLSENINKKKILEKQYEDIIKFYQDTNYKHHNKLIKHLKLKIDEFSEIRNSIGNKFLTKKEQIEILKLVDIKPKKKEEPKKKTKK